MVTVVGNGHGGPSHNPVYISYRANVFGKGMNPIIFFAAMGK